MIKAKTKVHFLFDMLTDPWFYAAAIPAVLLFGIAKGFGFERILKKKFKELVEKVPGQEEVLTKVMEYAESMLEAAKGGLIAGIGLVAIVPIATMTVTGVLTPAEAGMRAGIVFAVVLLLTRVVDLVLSSVAASYERRASSDRVAAAAAVVAERRRSEG